MEDKTGKFYYHVITGSVIWGLFKKLYRKLDSEAETLSVHQSLHQGPSYLILALA